MATRTFSAYSSVKFRAEVMKKKKKQQNTNNKRFPKLL